jgi:drug/metabolite transporter (DMT)-like permease
VPQLALVVAILAVSTSAPLVHLAAPAPPLTVAAARVCLTAVLLTIASGPRLLRAFRELDKRDRWLVASSGLLLGAHFGVWISSLYLTSTAASVALVATQPIFAGLFGWLLLSEGVSRRAVGGIAVAAIGCAVLASGDLGGAREGALLGDVLAVLGAVTAAGYFVLGRRLRASLPLIPYLAMVNLVAGLVLLVTATALDAPFTGFEPKVYVALVLCAVIPSIVGHTLLNWSVRRVPVHLVSLAILGEPIGASLLTWASFGEVPPIHAAIGGAVILLGIGLGFVKRAN